MDEEIMDRLLVRLENKLRASWRAMIRAVKDDNALAELERKIAIGDVENLLVGLEDAAAKYVADMSSGYIASGQRMARYLDAELDGAHVRFDAAADDAVAWMQRNAAEWTRSFVDEQTKVARAVVSEGRYRGFSDSAIADDVRASIGLNEQALHYVETYRDALETGDFTNAIARELADGRYDRALELARDQGSELTEARVDTMVDRYRDNWVSSRGERISGDDANEVTNEGVDEATAQAIDSGDLPDQWIIGTWVTRDDKRVRPSHFAMHLQERPSGEPFESGNGVELMYPGDPDADASETAGCRCVRTIRVIVPTAVKTFRRAELARSQLAA